MNRFLIRIMILVAACLILKCGEQRNKFTFVQMCDPQIHMDADDSFFQVTGTIERFQTAIRQINALQPDFVVICGDHVQRSNPESFSRYLEMQEKCTVPCFSVPGNHDFNPVRGDERATPERLRLYREYLGEDYFTFEHKGTAFIFINTPLLLACTGGPHWRVEPFEGVIKKEYDKHLAWIHNTLFKYQKTDTPIFMIAHHPLHPDMPGLAPGALTTQQRADLAKAFKETGVRAVLGGHGHKVYIKEHDDIAFVHAHTTSFNLEEDPQKRDPFGFRLWHVSKNGSFHHEFVPLDNPRDLKSQ